MRVRACVSMAVGGSLDGIKWVSVGLRVSKLLEQNVAATTNEGESSLDRRPAPVDGGGEGGREGGKDSRYMQGEKLCAWLAPNCYMFFVFLTEQVKMGVL